jgi:hypothetical protein
MFASIRWILARAWRTDPARVAGLVALALARSTVAAGLALTARGLLNTAVAELHGGQGRLAPLIPWLLAGLVFALVEALAPIVSAHIQRRLGDALQLHVTSEVLAHAAGLDPVELAGTGRRTLLERARDGSARQLTRLLTDLLAVGTEVVQSVLLAGVLFHIEPLTLAIVVPATALYLLAEWRATRRHQAEAPARALKQRWTRYFAELLTGERSGIEVRLLGLVPTLLERFRTLSVQLEEDQRTRSRRQLRASVAFGIATTLIFYAVLALVAGRAVTGRLTVGDIAVFVAASSRLRSTLSRLVVAVMHIIEAVMAADAIRAFLALRSAPAPARPRAAGPSPTGVVVEDVWFTYPGAVQPALAGVSLRVRPGEIVAGFSSTAGISRSGRSRPCGSASSSYPTTARDSRPPPVTTSRSGTGRRWPARRRWSSASPRGPAWTISCAGSPAATRRRSGTCSGSTICPPANGSRSSSPARTRAPRLCCSSTRPRRTWTSGRSATCWSASRPSRPIATSCWSHTGPGRWRSPTASSCSSAGRSSRKARGRSCWPTPVSTRASSRHPRDGREPF